MVLCSEWREGRTSLGLETDVTCWSPSTPSTWSLWLQRVCGWGERGRGTVILVLSGPGPQPQRAAEHQAEKGQVLQVPGLGQESVSWSGRDRGTTSGGESGGGCEGQWGFQERSWEKG